MKQLEGLGYPCNQEFLSFAFFILFFILLTMLHSGVTLWYMVTKKCSKTKNYYWIYLKFNIFDFSCDYRIIHALELISTFFQYFQFGFAHRFVNLLKFSLFKISFPITWHLKWIKNTQSGTIVFLWSMIFSPQVDLHYLFLKEKWSVL